MELEYAFYAASVDAKVAEVAEVAEALEALEATIVFTNPQCPKNPRRLKIMHRATCC